MASPGGPARFIMLLLMMCHDDTLSNKPSTDEKLKTYRRAAQDSRLHQNRQGPCPPSLPAEKSRGEAWVIAEPARSTSRCGSALCSVPFPGQDSERDGERGRGRTWEGRRTRIHTAVFRPRSDSSLYPVLNLAGRERLSTLSHTAYPIRLRVNRQSFLVTRSPK